MVPEAVVAYAPAIAVLAIIGILYAALDLLGTGRCQETCCVFFC